MHTKRIGDTIGFAVLHDTISRLSSSEKKELTLQFSIK